MRQTVNSLREGDIILGSVDPLDPDAEPRTPMKVTTCLSTQFLAADDKGTERFYSYNNAGFTWIKAEVD